MSRPPSDISGQLFNRLRAVRFAEHRLRQNKKYSYWEFVCDCGAVVIASKQHVMTGKKKSCGCAPVGCGRRLEFGRAAFNDLYRKYQKSAKRRRKQFSLTEEDFRLLTSSDCSYCGAKPSQRSGKPHFRKGGKIYQLYGEYIYTGVDRVNNEEGYTKSNCVPCCETCNRAKLQMTCEEFVAWIKRVYEQLCR